MAIVDRNNNIMPYLIDGLTRVDNLPGCIVVARNRQIGGPDSLIECYRFTIEPVDLICLFQAPRQGKLRQNVE